jgi:hypothetical protein
MNKFIYFLLKFSFLLFNTVSKKCRFQRKHMKNHVRLAKTHTICVMEPCGIRRNAYGFFCFPVCDIVQHTLFIIGNRVCCCFLIFIYVSILFETPHIFRAITADTRLTHPSEDEFATPVDNPQVQGITIA